MRRSTARMLAWCRGSGKPVARSGAPCVEILRFAPVTSPGVARLGILGLPNVGKTTLFNALTGLDAPTAPHPFSTTEVNLGVARVPDAHLDEAAVLEGSKKVVHATLDLADFPSASGGGGLSARSIARLREAEALVVVLRAFEDAAVADVESGTDPVSQAELLMLELAVADADVLGRRAEKAIKEATGDAARRRAADAIARAAAVVSDGTPLRSATWTDEELGALRDMAPVTLQPVVWVVNVAEEEPDGQRHRDAVAAVVPEGDEVVVLCARIEEEGARLEPDERAELFEGLGWGEGALATVVRATYSALGLISFFTLGPKESRAWTVRRGASAVEAAGKIHSDLQRGFIRAEVLPIETVVAAGGWDAAKASGSVRVEGRDYRVTEGDVIVVRFSV
jgi:ribosome-binding ATPase